MVIEEWSGSQYDNFDNLVIQMAKHQRMADNEQYESHLSKFVLEILKTSVMHA